jgi:hypothetical protein
MSCDIISWSSAKWSVYSVLSPMGIPMFLQFFFHNPRACTK